MNQEEYIKDRIDGQIEWYGRKSQLNKKFYVRSRTAIIFISASIPFLSGIDTTAYGMSSHVLDVILKNFIGLLGAVITIFTGLIGFMKYQEKWTKYRMIAEQLKREKMMFFTRAGMYKDDKDTFPLLVQNVEKLLNQEVDEWNTIINDDDKK